MKLSLSVLSVSEINTEVLRESVANWLHINCIVHLAWTSASRGAREAETDTWAEYETDTHRMTLHNPKLVTWPQCFKTLVYSNGRHWRNGTMRRIA